MCATVRERFSASRDDWTMTRAAEAPDSYHSINPYIVVEGVEELVGFFRTPSAASNAGGARSRRTARSDTPR